MAFYFATLEMFESYRLSMAYFNLCFNNEEGLHSSSAPTACFIAHTLGFLFDLVFSFRAFNTFIIGMTRLYKCR